MSMNSGYAAYQKFARPTQLLRKMEQEKSNDMTDQVQAQKKAADAAVVQMPISMPQTAQSTAHYLENEIMTATPEKLTLMLYDGLIKFLSQGVVYINTKNIPKTNTVLMRSQDIISELMSTLNMDIEISGSLYSLYDFMKTSVMQANIKKDATLLKEVIGLARELRETWVQAMKAARKGNA